MRRYIELVERAARLTESVEQDALDAGIPPAAAAKAEELYRKVARNPNLCGDSTVVDGYWIETHTYGCRNAADDPEDEWADRHRTIYQEYRNDGVSTVLGDPDDGVFVTLTPQRKS